MLCASGRQVLDTLLLSWWCCWQLRRLGSVGCTESAWCNYDRATICATFGCSRVEHLLSHIAGALG